MDGPSLQPGFRFYPTDEELVGYYLKRKVEGLEIGPELIPVVDLYKFDPWELPDKSLLPKCDREWFFFFPRDRKYPNRSETNRHTPNGWWRAIGIDHKVVCQSSVVGYRKHVVFYDRGYKTNWVMNEYHLCDHVSQGSPTFQGSFALCHLIDTNKQAQKTAGVRGYPKEKQVGHSSSTGSLIPTRNSSEPLFVPDDSFEDYLEYAQLLTGSTKAQKTAGVRGYLKEKPVGGSSSTGSLIPTRNLSEPLIIPDVTPFQASEGNEPASMGPNPSDLWDWDFIIDSTKECPPGQGPSGYFPNHEFSNTLSQPYSQYELSSNSSYSSFREEIESADDLSLFGYSGQGNEQNDVAITCFETGSNGSGAGQNYVAITCFETGSNVSGAEQNDVAITCLEEKGGVGTSETEFRTNEISISYEVLKQHFGKKLDDAAKCLGVSRSTLKRICRSHGINKWPCHKRSKVNSSPSNRKAVNKSDQGGNEQIPKSSRRDPSFSDKAKAAATTPNVTQLQDVVAIKVKYKDAIIKFQLSSSSGMAELVEKVTKRLPLKEKTFSIKYEDNDGDLVLITCDEDLQYCMDSSRSLPDKTTIRMFVDEPITNQAP